MQFMDVVKVSVPPSEHLSVQALYDAAIALYWKISERQNSTHLTFELVEWMKRE